MTMLVIRPDDWNFPLLLHVGGAMLLIGTLTVAAGSLLLAWRSAEPGASSALTRFAFRTILVGVFPSFILMRGAAQWIASREGLDESKATWIGIGYFTGDVGLPLLVIAAILAGIASRRGGLGVLGRISAVLTVILLIAYIVSIWAMSAKPS